MSQWGKELVLNGDTYVPLVGGPPFSAIQPHHKIELVMLIGRVPRATEIVPEETGRKLLQLVGQEYRDWLEFLEITNPSR